MSATAALVLCQVRDEAHRGVLLAARGAHREAAVAALTGPRCARRGQARARGGAGGGTCGRDGASCASVRPGSCCAGWSLGQLRSGCGASLSLRPSERKREPETGVLAFSSC